MITTQHTITCDKCEYEECFEDIKLLTAIMRLRELGWIINQLADENAICPRCAALEGSE